MIKIDKTIKEFLDTLDDSSYYMAAYKFTLEKEFKYLKSEFKKWESSLKPYEKELVKATKLFTENLNPTTQGDYIEIPELQKHIPKFWDEQFYEGYFSPTEENMALYFYIKYPNLFKFPGVDFERWEDGCTASLHVDLYTKEEIQKWVTEMTLDEYKGMIDGTFTVEDYIKKYPLAEAM